MWTGREFWTRLDFVWRAVLTGSGTRNVKSKSAAQEGATGFPERAQASELEEESVEREREKERKGPTGEAEGRSAASPTRCQQADSVTG